MRHSQLAYVRDTEGLCLGAVADDAKDLLNVKNIKK